MTEIKLEGIEFFAYHGHHDEERVTGNKYSVDIRIQTDLNAPGESDDLKDTINYEVIYKLIKEEMGKPARLLEYLAHQINIKVLSEYKIIESVQTSVSKFNPPLGGICRRATVSIKKDRSD